MQRSSSGVFLLLVVLPIDRVKDILKSAKLLRNGDYTLDAIKLTAKEWEALKEFEKSADVVKTVDRGKDHGKLIGKLDGLTKEEISAVDRLRSQGKNVEIIPVDPKAKIKTPDFKVNGIKTELKTLVNPNTNTGMKRIQEAFRQNTNDVIIDGINAGLTKKQAEEILTRAAGKYPNGKFPGNVEIWTIEGIIKSK